MPAQGLCAQGKLQAGSNGFSGLNSDGKVRSELLVTGNTIQRLNQGSVSKIRIMGLACLAGSAVPVLGREESRQPR